VGDVLLLSSNEEGFLNTACTTLGLSKEHAVFGRLNDLVVFKAVDGLGEFVYLLVVVNVVSLSVSSRVSLISSPGVLGSGHGAISLNGDVVSASADSEETILSPVGTPRVTDEPVLVTVLDTISDNRDIVNNVRISGSVAIDSSLVCFKRVGDGDTASERSTLGNFLLHGCLTLDSGVLVDTVNLVVIGDEASLGRVAISGDLHSGALGSVVVTTGQVDGSLSIGDLVGAHPLESLDGFSSVATTSIVIKIARDEDLGRDVDIGPGCLTGDLDTIGEGRGGGLSPARSAVLRDVLVPDVGQVVDTTDVVPKNLLGDILQVGERSVDEVFDQSLRFLVSRELGVNVPLTHDE